MDVKVERPTSAEEAIAYHAFGGSHEDVAYGALPSPPPSPPAATAQHEAAPWDEGEGGVGGAADDGHHASTGHHAGNGHQASNGHAAAVGHQAASNGHHAGNGHHDSSGQHAASWPAASDAQPFAGAAAAAPAWAGAPADALASAPLLADSGAFLGALEQEAAGAAALEGGTKERVFTDLGAHQAHVDREEMEQDMGDDFADFDYTTRAGKEQIAGGQAGQQMDWDDPMYDRP